MKIPNWLRIVWWILLFGVMTVFLWLRASVLIAGDGTAIDGLILLIWLGLALAPVFNEVNLFGLKLRQEIGEMREEVAGLRAEIRNSVDVRTQINPTFQVPLPPPDSQLPVLEDRMRNVLQEVFREYGLQRPETPTEEPQVDEEAAYLFKVRYTLEREIRRIWERRMGGEFFKRPPSAMQMASVLVNEGYIDPRLLGAIRGIYAVASPAIHGEPVSEAKLEFVREVSPDAIAALGAIT